MGGIHVLVVVGLILSISSERAPSIKDFRDAMDTISGKIYSAQARDKPKDDLLFSPISIASCLAMLAEGASGKTKADLEGIAKLTQKARDQFGYVTDSLQNKAGSTGVDKLRMVNSIWIPMKDKMPLSFHEAVTKRYFAETRSADFSKGAKVAQLVNERISKITDGSIEDLLSADSITPNTQLMMTNALYFNGKWVFKFDKKDTVTADFTNSRGEKVEVNMMNSNVSIRAGAACCGIKAVVAALPYSPEERFSLVIVVPEDPLGYAEVEKKLTTDFATFSKVVRRLSLKEIELSLPKFEMKVTLGLKFVFDNMGLGKLFTDEAELTQIIHNQRASLTSAIHKAKINVDEDGTEAAAASAFQITPLMADFDNTKRVRADRTFIFAIWDNDNEIPLFLGRVANPARAGSSKGRTNQPREARFKRESETEDEMKNGEESQDKGVTGPANWWKPTPIPEVLIPLKKPHVANSVAAPQFAKWPGGLVEPEAIPINPNHPPISIASPTFLQKPVSGPIFSGVKGVLNPINPDQEPLNFPGLVVRQPEKIGNKKSEGSLEFIDQFV